MLDVILLLLKSIGLNPENAVKLTNNPLLTGDIQSLEH